MVKIIDKRPLVFLGLLFFIAFSIRIIYLLEFQHKNPYFDAISPAFDHYNFDKGAINFSKGDLLATAPNNSFSPLYKYFLGIIYLLFGRNFYLVYSIQFAMGAVSSVLIFLIAKDLFSFRAGIIAFLGFAFYSPQIVYEGIILRAAFISFLGVLSFYLLYRLKDFCNTGNLLIATLALSLFIQARPNAIICLPFVCIYLYKTFSSIEHGERIRNWVIFAATLLLSFTPLLIQCYMVWGKFVFFDASGPNAFVAGNLISYSGVGHDISGIKEYLKENELTYQSLLNFYPHYIFDNFTEFIKLYFRKIYFFLNEFEAPSNISVDLYRGMSTTLPLLWGSFALYSSLGITGMFLAVKNIRGNFLLYAYIVSLSFSVIIFHNSSRYRIPVVPYFIIFSSFAVDMVIVWITRRNYKKAIAIVFAAVLLFMFFIKPEGLRGIRPVDYNNVANAWFKKGNIKKAFYYIDKAILADPLSDLGYFNRGHYSLSKNDLQNGIIDYRKALILSNRDEDSKRKKLNTLFDLGNRFLINKKFGNAIDIYLLILEFDPENIDVLLNIGASYASIEEVDKAKKIFESILKIDQNHSGAIKNLSMLNFK